MRPPSVAVFVAPPEAVSVLRAVLSELPIGFPASILILLHAGTGTERPVADNLNVSSAMMVMPGLDGSALHPEHAYVVLPAHNLALGDDGALTVAAPAPDVEPLLASVAAQYGKDAIAVALTALDPRESEGFRLIQAAGGHTIALDEADRLWTRPAGPRVVPSLADERLPAAIGKRMLAMIAAPSLP